MATKPDVDAIRQQLESVICDPFGCLTTLEYTTDGFLPGQKAEGPKSPNAGKRTAAAGGGATADGRRRTRARSKSK